VVGEVVVSCLLIIPETSTACRGALAVRKRLVD
jgi:hypothetical protein